MDTAPEGLILINARQYPPGHARPVFHPIVSVFCRAFFIIAPLPVHQKMR